MEQYKISAQLEIFSNDDLPKTIVKFSITNPFLAPEYVMTHP
jgi:hypothetical protein